MTMKKPIYVEPEAYFNEAMKEAYDQAGKEKFVEDTSKKVYEELAKEDKSYLCEHPNPIEHHFGLGLYIRNQFIHGKDLHFFYLQPDDLSIEVVKKVIELCQKEQSSSMETD